MHVCGRAQALVRPYELSETRFGLVAVINDLHKGCDSGSGWSVVIDLSAVLMVLVSLTGLVAAALGALLAYLACHLFVP